MKRKIILKPGGGGFLGGVIIRSLLRWDGSKTARKFGDRHLRSPKSTSKKTSSKKKPVRMIEENDSEDDFLPMKSKKKIFKEKISKKIHSKEKIFKKNVLQRKNLQKSVL